MPIDISRIKKKNINTQLLRMAIVAELDAINLYEQMADMTDDINLKKIFLDVAREEKTHVGEFQALLLKKDKQQIEELKEGSNEVKEMTG